jgi:hypothetical protein
VDRVVVGHDIPSVEIRVCAYAFVASILGFPPENRAEAVSVGPDPSSDDGDLIGCLGFDGERFSFRWHLPEGLSVSGYDVELRGW